MGGIAGWLAPPAPDLNRGTLAAMLQSMACRGPDDEGMLELAAGPLGHRVFLGHRRLAIIDVNGARQPMSDAGAGLSLIFDGEIYNFRELRETLAREGYCFRLDSDTEVLLRAYRHWGEDVVKHLRGSFAFALWDARRERLLLARDRFGEKPLFFHESDGRLFFASEAKALLRLPYCRASTDLKAVWDYLAYRYVPAPKTLFAGIRKLMPGTLAVWQGGKLCERRYWTAPDRARLNGHAPPAMPQVVDNFLGRVDEAVKLQMVSDVPFGAFLSGNLDSSMIVALMSRHCRQVRTFSVGFGDAAANELASAARVARCFGTVHHELTVSSRDVIDELPRLVAYRDAPVSEPADLALYRLACAASRTVKMVLTGAGSDEILGGYPRHVYEQFSGAWRTLPNGLRDRLIAPLVHALPARFQPTQAAVATLDVEDPQERYLRWFDPLENAGRERLSVLRRDGAVRPVRPLFNAAPDSSALRRILYFDQTGGLPDNLLERGDRMSMAASVETRVPFLDHRLAEFVSALPDRYRVRGLRTKWILREAARHVLPASVLKRSAADIRIPVNARFRHEMRDFLVDHLQGPQSLTRPYFHRKTLDGVLTEHLNGHRNHEMLLWSLLNLEIWHRQYVPGRTA